jgi:HTH-type transcriptional repressor of NAD biosynthesis genes
MTRIAKGQAALQRQGQMLRDKPFIIQDTDLYSTVGYWNLHLRDFGFKPYDLEENAGKLMSDLYIITKSNIPFEADPLRYGGDKREGSDEFWIELLNKYSGTKYVVLESDDRWDRVDEALLHLDNLYKGVLSYDRITKETLGV